MKIKFRKKKKKQMTLHTNVYIIIHSWAFQDQMYTGKIFFLFLKNDFTLILFLRVILVFYTATVIQFI